MTDPTTVWLDHLFACVKRHVHRYGFRMVQASGTLSQLYVSLDEARGLLGTRDTGAAPPAALQLPPLAQIEAEVEATGAALRAALEADGPLRALARRFRLDADALTLLLAAAGPLVSVDLARLYAFAWADFAIKLPSVGFLCELIAATPTDAARLHDAFRAGAPLRRYRLIELRDAPAWGADSPLLHRGVVAPDAVLSFLRGGLDALSPGLTAACRVAAADAAPPLDALFVDDTVRADLATSLARAVETGRPRLVVAGSAGSGRRTLISSLAATHGWGTLTVDLERLPGDPEPFAARLAEAAREALLRRCVLILRGDALAERREDWDKRSAVVGQLVDQHDGPVVFTAHLSAGALHPHVSDLFDVALSLPSTHQQREVWRRALERGHPDDAVLADDLARRFSVSPGTIHGAVYEARARKQLVAPAGARLELEDVAHAVRRRLQHALAQVAEPFTTSLTWDDVILPKEVSDTLAEVLAQARHREFVYDTWGFRRKMAYGRGLACLFSGPPGTGKTMVAGLIAKDLGRELYRVDLSRVVSKWVGETEKNLARVFDEAEKAQVILLFDEADSLFSSRTEVRGSNDRFANMEINYLLQRMEQYDGMSLLTTNFEKSIDEAFKRRLKFRIDFPLPDAVERARLWEVMLPDRADVAEDVRFDQLGKKYKLAGGSIKNAVLRAAFYAAEAGTAIDHALLDKAAVAEAREMGRLI